MTHKIRSTNFFKNEESICFKFSMLRFNCLSFPRSPFLALWLDFCRPPFLCQSYYGSYQVYWLCPLCCPTCDKNLQMHASTWKKRCQNNICCTHKGLSLAYSFFYDNLLFVGSFELMRHHVLRRQSSFHSTCNSFPLVGVCDLRNKNYKFNRHTL